MTEISDTLLKQRLRNRLIESLDAFADNDTVEAVGTDEIIQIWYDYMDEDRMEFFDEPVFSVEELNAIKRFHNLLDKTHQNIPSTWKLEELEGIEEWSALVAMACKGVSVFYKRGLLDEETEIT